MALENLKGLSQDQQFEEAAKFAGVPASILRGMWRTESANGTNMKSAAGAEGHFQIMPATKAVWEKRTGRKLDPYDFADGITLAALTMKENLQAADGDIDTALKMYNGGWDKKNWNNPETQAYVGKVRGGASSEVIPATSSTSPANDNMEAAFERAWGGTPAQQEAVREKEDKKPILSTVEKGLIDQLTREAAADALLSGKDANAVAGNVREIVTAGSDQLATIANNAVEPGFDASTELQDRQIRSSVARSVHKAEQKQNFTFRDSFGSFMEGGGLAAVLRAKERQYFPDYDKGVPSWYYDNIEKYEQVSDSEEDRNMLRKARSPEAIPQIREHINDKRRAAEYQAMSEHPFLMGTLAGLTDPVYFGATLGVGTAFRAAGVGTVQAIRGGQAARAFGFTVAEGVTGSLLTDAGLVALGEHRSGFDFLTDAGFGALFGAGFGAKAAHSATVQRAANDFIERARIAKQEDIIAAQNNLGGDATPEAIIKEADRIEFDRDQKWLQATLGDTLDAERLTARPDVNAPRAAAPEPVVIPGRYVATVKDGSEYSIRVERRPIAGKDDAMEIVVVDKEGNILRDSLGREAGLVLASPTGGNLSVRVSDEFQGQGIAKALYRVAELEGADLGDPTTGKFKDGTTSNRTEQGQGFRENVDLSTANVRAATKAPAKSPFPVNALLDTKKKRKALVEKYQLNDRISDDAERIQVSEIIARAERILSTNSIDKTRLQTILSKADLEATSTTLLNDKSPVSRAVAIMLMENPEGAAGRKRTAALTRDIQFQQYLGNTNLEFLSAFDQWRTTKGKSPINDFLTNNADRKAFDKLVAITRDEQYNGKPVTSKNKFVLAAAETLNKPYDQMRIHQRFVGVVGFENLPEKYTPGYSQRQWDLRALTDMAADPIKRRAFLSAVQDQFEKTAGFTAGDDEFTKALSIKYFERLMQRAAGAHDVPANLYSSDTADILRDSLKALKLNEEEVQKALSRFSRGGSSHTKGRIDMDMTHVYDDGNGGKFQLIDYLDNNHLANLRQYAARTAGDVSLAKYGIMGHAGALEVRKAMDVSGSSKEALRAYDQFIAEMRGQPFGSADHKWLVNARVLTGATKLGGALFPQLGDYLNSVLSVGVEGALKAVGGIPRLRGEILALLRGEKVDNGVLTGLETMGMEFGTHDYRLMGMYDVDEHVTLYGKENVTVVDRFIRGSGNAVRVLSGHRALVAVQTRGMAEQIVQKAWRYIRDGVEDKALDDMGINAAMRDRMRKQMGKVIEWDERGNVKVFDPAKCDPEFATDFVTFRDAVHRGASQIVQRDFPGETGKWAHNGLLKSLFQMRTYSLIAHQKQLGRVVAVHGKSKAAYYAIGAMSMAIPIHAARVMLKASLLTEADREKLLDEQLNPIALAKASANYVGSLGLLPDLLDTTGSFASGWVESFGMELPTALEPTGGRTMANKDILGGQFAPSLGVVNDLAQGIGGNRPKLIRSLPGSNLPYIQPLWMGAESQLDE